MMIFGNFVPVIIVFCIFIFKMILSFSYINFAKKLEKHLDVKLPEQKQNAMIISDEIRRNNYENLE